MAEKKQFSYENLSKYRNVLMGLQIILIIIFHYTADSYYVKDSAIIHLFWKYIRSSGVDIFLLLSGLGLYFSWKRNPNARIFYIKRYTRILIPYFIVAIPAWLYLDIFVLERGWIAFIKDLFFISFFFDQTRWFWYIMMIGLCYWVFPYIFKIVESAADRITAQMRILLLCGASTLILMMLQLYHNNLYSNVSIAVTRIPAFLIGVFVGRAVYEKRIVPRKNIWIMAVLAVLIAYPLQMVTKKIIGVYSLAFLNYSLSLIFIMLLAYLCRCNNKCMAGLYSLTVAILGWFGKYTLELYLLHVMVRKILNQLGYPTYRLAYEAILVIISIVLSIILSRGTGWIQKKIQRK